MRYGRPLAIFLFSFLVLGLIGARISLANQEEPGGRHQQVEVTIQQYIWHVVSKSSGKTLCEIITEYNREPTPDETMAVCSQEYAAQSSTPAAGVTPQPTPVLLDRNAFLSSILYRLVETRQFTRTLTIPMQDMVLNIEVLPGKIGDSEAFILLSAYEPEPEYQITEIRGTINGALFSCDAPRCKLAVVQDSQIEFWAVSSFGDESEHVTAILRVTRRDGYPAVEITSLYPYQPFVDYCAQTWASSDYVAPKWAEFPLSPEDLNTNKELYYLAGQLINTGLADASACPSNGLTPNLSPNGCGLDAARDEMTAWQNQYDVIIWSSGRKYGIPPILVKSILELESQFWPANLRRFLDEYGLAQISQWGADVALRWDHSLYQEICSGILSECNLPYASLPPPLQAILRGGLVRAINAECPECAGGINYARAVKSIPTITRVIRSNCRQTKYIVDARQATPSYEDMWKFTMVSYHSGYYCLDEGIRRTQLRQQGVTWNNFAGNVDPSCIGAVDYIDTLWKALTTFDTHVVSEEPPVESLPNAGIVPAPTPTPSPTPVRSRSELRVSVFIDKNNNQVEEDQERVSGLQVIVTFEDGSTLTRKTENGVAVFNLGGREINSRVTVRIPLLFRSQDLLIPEDGVVPLSFEVEQSDLLPVLP